MAGYDQYVTDPAADDADRRAKVSPECEDGNHAACGDEAMGTPPCDFPCACDCHAPGPS